VTLNFQTQCSGSTYTSLGGTGCTTVSPVVIPLLTGALPITNPPGSLSGQRFSLQVMGSSVMMRMPTFSGNLRVSIVDLWGRKVWSRTVTSGTAVLSWNGVSPNGQTSPSGVYIVRLVAQDASLNSGLLAESKFLLAH